MQKFSATVCLLLMMAGCGGVSVTPNPDPVSVSASVSMGGKPTNDIMFHFQPIEGGLPADVAVKNGKFEAQVTPGKYTWYISSGASPASFEAVPTAYHAGSLERTLEVKAGDALDIKLD